jgi:hypothetical protein
MGANVVVVGSGNDMGVWQLLRRSRHDYVVDDTDNNDLSALLSIL